ncbi:MAG: RNA-binding transcriptional accessory protein [Firmicutes bacterium]|nr:RNA-binding transcriptional accessory protein [Bacillota bacterium]
MDIKKKLSEEFNLKLEYSSNLVDLLSDPENTVPFIARYRKEMHGECDDQVIREFADRLTYLNNLIKRKEEVKKSIEEQEKWTDELAAALESAQTLTEVEDIYRPYKQKKKTRASVAIAKGLEPLADIIQAQELKTVDFDELCAPYIVTSEDIDAKLHVATTEDALNGACDIIAERISDDAALRKILRELLHADGLINAKLEPKDEKNEKVKIFEMYKEHSEKIATIVPHRILAINRGENEECLKVHLSVDEETALNKIRGLFKKESVFNELMERTIADSYKRLIFPSVENEVRGELFEVASEQAIKMFEVNLKPLLMSPPLKGKVILGLDPGFRTGCKIAVIDEEGNVLDTTVIYPTPPQQRIKESTEVLTKLIKKHNIDVIAIGNGTASKESEIFVAGLIKELDRPVNYIVVNEAGASVYSASKLAAEEFPDLDLTARSAVSIARRLLDPLAELIKIDTKSIGVGQYQHDMPKARLTQVLDGVVEDCVNSVGVDLNSASYSLMAYISGLNTSIAKNIVEYRKEKPFKSRDELLKVKKLGPKAYEQCAGFLRILKGENILDNTSVHPESYEATEKLLKKYEYSDADVKEGKLTDLANKVAREGSSKVADEIGIGEPTLNDIVKELMRPGRDIREDLPPPILRDDLLDIKDLKEGMEIIGTVRNVIDFGAFIDIGVHHDGLCHISEISDDFIKHPSQALTVGDIVKARVIGVDVAKNRINLSLKTPGSKPIRQPKEGGSSQKDRDRLRTDRNDRPHFNRDSRPPKQEESLEDKLKALQGKFGHNKRK